MTPTGDVVRSQPPESQASARPRRAQPFADAGEVARVLNPSYPVFCVRPHVLERNARAFLERFPGRTLYAVKCNPHPQVLDAFYAAGLRAFDTASLPEVAQLSEAFDDAECHFMHPVKPRGVIDTAHRVYGVRTFVVDHINELRKLAEQTGNDPEVVAVVRLKTEETDGTLYHLSAKFGAERAEAVELLREIARRGLRCGVAFHVGSQCLDPQAYRDALKLAGEVLREAAAEPSVLDVGGGFPAPYLGSEFPPLETFFEAIREGVAALGLPASCEIFCEPGRALAATGQSLLLQVQLRKGHHLYVNDGIYGGLSEMVAANVRYPARLIRLEGTPAPELQTFAAHGPTCDSLDMIPNAFRLPQDVREGDWIEVDRLGAYSNALATHFNGFHPDTFVEVRDEPPGGN